MVPTIETGDRLRATLTDRTYRVLGVGASQVRVVALPDGGCRAFAVASAELARDIEAGRIEVIGP